MVLEGGNSCLNKEVCSAIKQTRLTCLTALRNRRSFLWIFFTLSGLFVIINTVLVYFQAGFCAACFSDLSEDGEAGPTTLDSTPSGDRMRRAQQSQSSTGN